MKKEITCGDRASTIIGQLEGMITATSERFGSKTYELTYYFGGEVKTTWLREEELCFDAVKEPIGLASKVLPDGPSEFDRFKFEKPIIHHGDSMELDTLRIRDNFVKALSPSYAEQVSALISQLEAITKERDDLFEDFEQLKNNSEAAYWKSHFDSVEKEMLSLTGQLNILKETNTNLSQENEKLKCSVVDLKNENFQLTTARSDAAMKVIEAAKECVKSIRFSLSGTTITSEDSANKLIKALDELEK